MYLKYSPNQKGYYWMKDGKVSQVFLSKSMANSAKVQGRIVWF